MYVCMLIYLQIFASIAAPAQRLVVYRNSCFNDGQAADEACSYAALIGLTAAIRIHCRAGPAAVVHSHCCTGSAAVCRCHCRADPAADIRSLCRAGAAVVFRS